MQFNDEIKYVFSLIEDCCAAIYLGGSRVDPVIENPHDYDYICFAKHLKLATLIDKLNKLGFKQQDGTEATKPKTLLDMTQIRYYPYTQINWFSYLDHYMIKIIGDEVCNNLDIINKYRKDYLLELKDKAHKLLNIWTNASKRWYHILRGVYILLNNSYDVTEEQKKEINILHDLSEGWEKIRDKTIQLLETLN